MKISIIEPKTPFFNFYSAILKYLPLLGPIYIGTMLKNKGHDVTIYNENIKEIDYSRIKDSDVLGISMITSTAPRGYEIAEKFRQLNPRGRVIIGGSHATFLPEEAAQYADHVVTGEGESVICDLVRYGGEKIISGSPVENLDDLPFPDFSLIDGVDRSNKPMQLTPVSTSRGCPFECTFCSVTAMFGRKYRYRSTESVIEEISRFKHRRIFFYDDNFDANMARTRELLEKMIERRITPNWIAQVRADIAKNEEMVALMAKANCGVLCIGFESLKPEVLKSYNKKQTPEDIRACIKMLHKYGIKIHGMFISDGYSDVYHRLGVDSLQLCILVPIIGSKLYTAVKSSGRFITDRFPTDWKLFDGGHVVHWPDNLSPVEMQRQTMQALRHYYSRVNMTKLFLKGQWVNFRLRQMGHGVLKNWEAQNKDYFTKLKQTSPLPLGYLQENP
ncbi:MAG: B12-binding domain-containing radical SAM protein [Dehalococcoidia bacterium]|nr:B12-binding domain-containing radical SAM protein [Dehalococcoidia bacterium]MCK5653531.1 B12-binding domain-containing radical SAM protein [Dehalococcoidia bacterium]